VPNSEDHAIVVGISDYATTDFQQLKAAVGDAVAFADWLRRPDGGDVPDKQIKVITKTAEIKSVFPIKDDIDDALKGIIKGRKTRIGRRFYFYFSGHGCSPSRDELLLLLANTDNETLVRNVGVAPYKKFMLDPALFDELVFIIDCCRNYQPVMATAQPPFLNPIPTSALSVNVRDFVALGTEFGAFSFAPDDANERSFFTKYLIEAFDHAINADGSVTAQSLDTYVRPKVEAATGLPGKTQTPEIPIKPNFVFKPGKPRQDLGGRLLSFTIPAPWTRPLELVDGQFKPLRRVNGSDGKFQIVLPPGLYEISYPADAADGENVVRQQFRVNPTGASAKVMLQPDKDRYDV
jgi:caspase domain-containing protein